MFKIFLFNVWLFLFSKNIEPVVGRTRISVLFEDFHNPRSKEYDGDCCDNLGSIWCAFECEHFFKICFTRVPAESQRTCVHRLTTWVIAIDKSSFKFPGSGGLIGTGVTNPIVFYFDEPYTGFGVRGEVWDDDSNTFLGIGREDDFIDKYSQNFNLPLTSSGQRLEVRGRRSTLGILVKTSCDTDWYGKKCDVYCQPKKSDQFTCDSSNGDKICKDGWKGHGCNQAICSDCTHGNCTAPQVCQCDDGWKDGIGGMCDVCEIKQGCKNGYCVKGNDCICKKDWSGALCDKNENMCKSSPCENGAVCTNDGPNKYTCQCVQGYTGQNCSKEMDACSEKPCKHGSVCVNKRTHYYCPCARGYTGKNCEIDVNDCQPDPCENGAKCVDGVDDFSCQCKPGWKGKRCHIDIDQCQISEPCKNNATCIDGPGHNFTCRCRAGFDGGLCENNIDDCKHQPCLNNGTCRDHVNNFNCTCKSGFKGRTCSNHPPCNDAPCGPHGNCTDVKDDDDYKCSCEAGYSGKNCEVNIDDCLHASCNNGTCVDQVNNYTCSCFRGFTGRHCNINIDDCASLPCQNGASCKDGVESYTCICTAGWRGLHCTENINDCIVPCDGAYCVRSPCGENGNCTDLVNNFTCNCDAGFEGQLCDKKIDRCSDDTRCENGGTCVNLLDDFRCICHPGFQGRNCGVDKNECASNPCSAKGARSCEDMVADFRCECESGYTGKLCETNIDDCNPDNYVNIPEGTDITSFGFCGKHGRCLDAVDNYSCNCSRGYEGIHCQYDINECQCSPCMNGGQCFEETSQPGFYCVCAPGFHGPLCQNEINECLTTNITCCKDSICVDQVNGYTCKCTNSMKGIDCCSAKSWCENNDTCSKNGHCSEGVGTFHCNCLPGFTGDMCQIDIDECLSNPCVHGSTCLNLLGNYTCLCPPGKTGHDCTLDINYCQEYNVTCKHNFECVNQKGGFKCSCPSKGFTQPLCKDVDECLPSLKSCPRDRECVNTIGSFRCDCLQGFEGSDCSKSIDDCIDNKCISGHTSNCLDDHHSYTCDCFGQWDGQFCQNRNTSLEDPCGCEHGVCVKKEGLQQCTCDQGFKGEKCLTSLSRNKSTGVNVTTLSIGASLAAVLVVLGVAFVLIRRRRKMKNVFEKHTNVSYSHRRSEDLQISRGDFVFDNPTYGIKNQGYSDD